MGGYGMLGWRGRGAHGPSGGDATLCGAAAPGGTFSARRFGEGWADADARRVLGSGNGRGGIGTGPPREVGTGLPRGGARRPNARGKRPRHGGAWLWG